MKTLDIVAKYEKTEASKCKHPIVRFKGTIHSWIKPHLYMGSVPATVLNCPYRIGLLAERGYKLKDTVEDLKESAIGTLYHDLVLDRNSDFTLESKKENKTATLYNSLSKSKKSITKVGKVAIPGVYKGLLYKGEIDLLVLEKSKILRLEEWKFPSRPPTKRRKDSGEIQLLVYSYFMSKIVGNLDFIYKFKVYDKRRNNSRDLLYWEKNGYDDYNEHILFQIEGIYDKSKVLETQRYLDISWSVFSGEKDCGENPHWDCPPTCKEGKEEYCPYYIFRNT